MARANWISDGEKYALLGMNVKVEEPVPQGELIAGLSVLANTRFDVPTHWLEWLGSIRIEQVQNCNLFLLAKLSSSTPDVLDGENKSLQQRVHQFYVGLLLSSRFAPAHRPVVLTGSRRDGEVGLRQIHDLEAPVPCAFRGYPAILPTEMHAAAKLAKQIEAMGVSSLPGGHWRLFRVLHLYMETRATGDLLERVHQYSRCIDGLILPAIGKTAQQFKSRTELFIGPRHHATMGEMYEMRSASEHLHESRYLEKFDRAARLDIMKKEAVAEYIVRSSLARIVNDSNLWPHFGIAEALAKFWMLTPAEQRNIWGDPINPLDALADWNEQYIHDGMLRDRE